MGSMDHGREETGGFSSWTTRRRGNGGFGVEKVFNIRDHPTPCEELWKRKYK